ncbi:MAG TPA: hypothetical protein VEJ67_04965 [Candidatus Cybelea sp.]|nr:hypothetical protein [Candidatus Cybelea sp.]
MICGADGWRARGRACGLGHRTGAADAVAFVSVIPQAGTDGFLPASAVTSKLIYVFAV